MGKGVWRRVLVRFVAGVRQVPWRRDPSQWRTSVWGPSAACGTMLIVLMFTLLCFESLLVLLISLPDPVRASFFHLEDHSPTKWQEKLAMYYLTPKEAVYEKGELDMAVDDTRRSGRATLFHGGSRYRLLSHDGDSGESEAVVYRSEEEQFALEDRLKESLKDAVELWNSVAGGVGADAVAARELRALANALLPMLEHRCAIQLQEEWFDSRWSDPKCDMERATEMHNHAISLLVGLHMSVRNGLPAGLRADLADLARVLFVRVRARHDVWNARARMAAVTDPGRELLKRLSERYWIAHAFLTRSPPDYYFFMEISVVLVIYLVWRGLITPEEGFIELCRWLLTMCIVRILRIISFTSTIFPNPHYNCVRERVGDGITTNDPLSERLWYVAKKGIFGDSGGCHDLVFSGHVAVYGLGIALFWRLCPHWYLTLGMFVLAVHSTTVNVLDQWHFSVDSIVGLYVTMLVYFLVLKLPAPRLPLWKKRQREVTPPSVKECPV